jgi:hypothetical protein
MVAVLQPLERRANRRHGIERRSLMQIEGGRAATATLMDLHDQGAFVVPPDDLQSHIEVGTRVQLLFRLPDATGYEHVLVQGTVRWRSHSAQHARDGFGVKFDAPSIAIARCLSRGPLT